MTSARRLLYQARCLGVHLEPGDGDSLILDFRGEIPPAFIEQLRARKTELRQLLLWTTQGDQGFGGGCLHMEPEPDGAGSWRQCCRPVTDRHGIYCDEHAP
ncbi:MAG: hypothetical protein ACM3JG_18790 [Thiohalocapsa sp.]